MEIVVCISKPTSGAATPHRPRQAEQVELIPAMFVAVRKVMLEI